MGIILLRNAHVLPFNSSSRAVLYMLKPVRSILVKRVLSGSRPSNVLSKSEAEKLSSIVRGLKCFSFIVCNKAFACCWDELCEKDSLKKRHRKTNINNAVFRM